MSIKSMSQMRRPGHKTESRNVVSKRVSNDVDGFKICICRSCLAI